jgi:hypothetical protein
MKSRSSLSLKAGNRLRSSSVLGDIRSASTTPRTKRRRIAQRIRKIVDVGKQIARLE